MLDQAVADQEGPYVVLVDDGEMLVNSPFEATLETVIREGRDLGRARQREPGDVAASDVAAATCL